MLPDALDAVPARHAVKFIYLVPNFQNPTGRTLPIKRRLAVAEIVRRHDTVSGFLHYRPH